jgi:hypothetical protein
MDYTVKMTPETNNNLRVNINIFSNKNNDNEVVFHAVKYITLKKISNRSGVKLERRENATNKTHYYKLRLNDNVILFSDDYIN